MTKDQKRISELEKQVKELSQQVLDLAMRPQYFINLFPFSPAPMPIYPDSPFYPGPNIPYQPVYPTITCSTGNVTVSRDLSNNVKVYN